MKIDDIFHPNIQCILNLSNIQCFLTGRYILNSPEEIIRQQVLISLIKDYGYSREDIEVEFPLNLGVKKKRVDIAIFFPDTSHKQENIRIIFECKRQDINLASQVDGINQLQSYLAVCVNAKFGIWVSSNVRIWKKTIRANRIEFTEVKNQPLCWHKNLPTQPRPIPMEIFNTANKLYSYIIQSKSTLLPFMEIFKLSFCKLFLDQTATVKIDMDTAEKNTSLLETQLSILFEQVKRHYPSIFSENERILLKSQELLYVFTMLQGKI
jgi:type I restriction enzyme M protein